MAKRKKYVQDRYSRILEKIRQDEVDCLPVYARSNALGVGPTVVYNFRPGPRARMPYLRAAKGRRRRRDNRVTLPPGPWIAEYVPIGSRSPLQEVLARGDAQELKANFIIVSTTPPKVKIFQFVEDLSAALRQTEHIFARYSRELDDLVQARSQLEEKLRRSRGGRRLPKGEEELSIRVEVAAINLRIAQIREIGADRAARDFNLQFVIRESFHRLGVYSAALVNLAQSVSRMGGRFRRAQVVEYLRLLDEELTFFASKEIRPSRSLARRQIHLITQDWEGRLNSGQVVAILSRASQYLNEAAKNLARWSEKLSEKEKRDAQSMRFFVVQGATPRQPRLL